jgi:hypothetical protein
MNETIWGLPYFYFLIGHRGVGKSTFLSQLSSRYPSLSCYDLDQEIERFSGHPVGELFVRHGEPAFRKLEKQILQGLLNKASPGSVIALGAGFELDEFSFPPSSLFHWLRRVSDSKGRIFFNRPLLPSWGADGAEKQDPYLRSYLERFEVREERYRRWASLEWLLPEGFEWHTDWQWGRRDLRGAIVTLTPWFLERPERQLWLSIFENFYVEVRSDLLGPDETRKLLKSCHPSVRKIFSLRPMMRPEWVQDVSFIWDVLDCDQSLLPPVVSAAGLNKEGAVFKLPLASARPVTLSSSQTDPKRSLSHESEARASTPNEIKEWVLKIWQNFSGRKILSSHTSTPPIDHSGVAEDWILKWSPLISSWLEVKQALVWMLEWKKQGRQAFLAPRWAECMREHEQSFWLREYLLTQQQGHFIRFDGMGSYSGQLPWNDYQHFACSRSLGGDLLKSRGSEVNRFMAVLGEPVSHSHSPAFHERYSLKKNAMFLRIPLGQEDLKPSPSQEGSFAFSVLAMLPITQAAITAPLKKSWINSGGLQKAAFPVNTWIVPQKGSSWGQNKESSIFYNTDLVALLWLWKLWQEKGLDYWLKEDLSVWRQDWEQGVQVMQSCGLPWPAVTWSFDEGRKARTLYQAFVKNFVRIFNIQNPQLPFYIYGQGAMGDILHMIFPEAISVGVREGQAKGIGFAQTRGDLDFNKQGVSSGLIWAGGPEASYQLWLEQELAWIWDMNYHEWSIARSLALQKNVPYLSGRSLFVIQAWWQQRLWGIDEK